jgi:transposase-like protein
MDMKCLFEYQSGVDRRKERALRLISEGYSLSDVCLELQISHKTLTTWIRPGLPSGDPELDQLSLIDGLTERERQRQRQKK